MCSICGCGVTPAAHGHGQSDAHGHPHVPASGGTAAVSVLKGLLDENDRIAAHNRVHFDEHGVLALNLMSSPGAGKTSLLEATIDALRGRLRMAVIEGDLETDNDARRIRAKGIAAVQITTGGACHLDANMVHRALHDLALEGLNVVFIENVGNLVCPASFDLGQHANVTLLSVTEGDDKPAKYPVMFRAADVVLLSKSDLLPHVGEFEPSHALRCLRELANPAPFIELSARTGAGMKAWFDWLLAQTARRRTHAFPA